MNTKKYKQLKLLSILIFIISLTFLTVNSNQISKQKEKEFINYYQVLEIKEYEKNAVIKLRSITKNYENYWTISKETYSKYNNEKFAKMSPFNIEFTNEDLENNYKKLSFKEKVLKFSPILSLSLSYAVLTHITLVTPYLDRGIYGIH